MFAFAIWDARHHCLFLARDQMGIKPLYYAIAEQKFLFASEIRTLLDTGLIPRRIDRAGLLNYLNFGSLYDPITLVESVSCLRPGHSLTWKKGVVSQRKYWDPLEHLKHPKSDHVHAAPPRRQSLEGKVTATLEQCLSMQTVSD